MAFHFPDYNGGSIVNLMSTLMQALGGKHQYAPLRNFDVDLTDKNVVLFIIDGLGHNFLQKHGQGTFLYDNEKLPITSAFPATTAVGVTALVTGYPAQQHGLVGWYVYFKELGMVTTSLPYVSRSGEISLKEHIPFSAVYDFPSFFESISTKSYMVTHSNFCESAYSCTIGKGAERVPYKTWNQMFAKTENILKESKERVFVNVYWGELDSIIHHTGTEHPDAISHLRDLSVHIAAFCERIKGTNTTVIISADHGMTNLADPEHIVSLDDHPRLKAMLTLPLTGDSRTAFCYVRAGKEQEFEAYVRDELSEVCELFRSEDLFKQGAFGLFEPHPRLLDRIGDYTLAIKEGYVIKDLVAGEEHRLHLGNHGGLSEDEILVPLIMAEIK